MRAVYDMEWREFLLRKAGYEREQLNKWEHTRMIAYWSGVDGGFDGRKTSISKFMPLGNETAKPVINEETRARFLEMQKEYYNKVNKKDGNSE